MAESPKAISGAQWAALATIIAAILGLCGTLTGFALNCVDKTGNIYCYRPPAVQQQPMTNELLPTAGISVQIQSQFSAVPTQAPPQPSRLPETIPPIISTNTLVFVPTLLPSLTPTLTLTSTPSLSPTWTLPAATKLRVTFDLYILAPNAIWASGAGPLTFGGPVNANGYVQYETAKLEDGTISNRLLTMHPEWIDDGLIKGLYPPYTITVGDHFRAQIGYIALLDGSCGQRSVDFQLHYFADTDGWITLGEWTKHCNYTLTNIDIDLSSIAGKTVQFNPVVMAHGSASQDWAVWVNPRIEN